MTGPEKHLKNLNRETNTLPFYANAYYNLKWNYRKDAKYMYSEPWQQAVIDQSGKSPIAKQFSTIEAVKKI